MPRHPISFIGFEIVKKNRKVKCTIIFSFRFYFYKSENLAWPTIRIVRIAFNNTENRTIAPIIRHDVRLLAELGMVESARTIIPNVIRWFRFMGFSTTARTMAHFVLVLVIFPVAVRRKHYLISLLSWIITNFSLFAVFIYFMAYIHHCLEANAPCVQYSLRDVFICHHWAYILMRNMFKFVSIMKVYRHTLFGGQKFQ